MGIEGRLQDIGLADICQLLAMGRKTGCLSVTDRSNFGYLYFEDGRVVYATVLNRRERLGEYLVRRGPLEQADIERARAAARGRPDVHYVRLLVEDGTLSPETLERFQAIEVEEAVYHLFTWEEGSFRFTTDEKPDPAVPVLVSLPAENLLLEGARRSDEWTQIREVVPSSDAVFDVVKDPRANGKVELTRHQEVVLEHLDGGRSVGRVVRESGMVEFDASRAIYEMVREGWLEPAGRAENGEAELGAEDDAPDPLALGRAFYGNGMFAEAERELLTCVEADPDCSEALDRLALIALREGRIAQALEYLDRAEDAAEPTYARRRNRALVLEKLGRLDEALAVLEGAVSLADSDPDLRLARGILLLKCHRAEEALAEFHGYREACGPDDPGPIFFAHALLAAGMAGETQEALRLGREGLTLHPWSGPILVNLGAILEMAGEPGAAEALYLRAVGESGTPPQAHRSLGDLALRRGDQAGARGHYERAVRLDPELGDTVLLRLGNLSYEDGEREAARRLWTRALELNPENEVARANLGLATSASRS